MAERITRLMGDVIYIPYAIEANGADHPKVFDPILHTRGEGQEDTDGPEMFVAILKRGRATHDEAGTSASGGRPSWWAAS